MQLCNRQLVSERLFAVIMSSFVYSTAQFLSKTTKINQPKLILLVCTVLSKHRWVQGCCAGKQMLWLISFGFKHVSRWRRDLSLGSSVHNRSPLHTAINARNSLTHLRSPLNGLPNTDLVRRRFNEAVIASLCPTELLQDLNLPLYVSV